MDKRYSTIIFVPHARAKFRKLKVSHRLLFSIDLARHLLPLPVDVLLGSVLHLALADARALEAPPREQGPADRQRAVQQVGRVAPHPARAPSKTAPASWPSSPASPRSTKRARVVRAVSATTRRREPLPRRHRQDELPLAPPGQGPVSARAEVRRRSRSSSPRPPPSRPSAASSPTASAAAPIPSPASRARTTRSTSPRPSASRSAPPLTASWSRPSGPTATAT